MNVTELARPERKEVIRLTPEQEARLSIARLTQQLLDLQIREPMATPDVIVMHGATPDKRTDAQKKTVPYVPCFETYALDRGGNVSLHFAETPTSLYLNVANITYPQPRDNIKVEFRRRGIEEVYTMVDGTKLSD